MQKRIRKLLVGLIGASLVLAMPLLAGCGSQQDSPEPGISVKSEGSTSSFDRTATIEKAVLVDIPEAIVTADALSFNNDRACLEITATNKTDSKISINAGTIGFSGNYINNYMVTSGYLGIDLEPQETQTEAAYFDDPELMLMGIDRIGEIGLGLTVKYNESGVGNSEEMNFDEIWQQIVQIKTSAYDAVDMGNDTYITAMNDPALLTLLGAEVVAFNDRGGFDQNGISIKSIGLTKNKDEDVAVFVEIANDTDSLVRATASDVSINGSMAYEGLWTGEVIAPGKIAVMDIALNSLVRDNADRFDLGNVSNVGIEFAVQDGDSNTIISPTELDFSF